MTPKDVVPKTMELLQRISDTFKEEIQTPFLPDVVEPDEVKACIKELKAFVKKVEEGVDL